MSDANELHPVGLVASSVDPTIKSATSAPVGSDPKERFKALEGLASTYLDKDELALLEKAFRFAEEMHAGQKRKSGEAFVIHPVEVAIILADLHMDVETLIAALLHDTVEDTVATKQQVAEMFGDSVAELVDGVTKITKIEVETLSDEQDARCHEQRHPRYRYQTRRPLAQYAHAFGPSRRQAYFQGARNVGNLCPHCASLRHQLHQMGIGRPSVLLFGAR